jgi:hypothetical protein
MPAKKRLSVEIKQRVVHMFFSRRLKQQDIALDIGLSACSTD